MMAVAVVVTLMIDMQEQRHLPEAEGRPQYQCAQRMRYR
jgi:hypothetical protein